MRWLPWAWPPRAVWRGHDKDGVDAVTAAAGMVGDRRWTVADEAVRPPSCFGAPDKDSVPGAAAAALARVTAGALDPSCDWERLLSFTVLAPWD